MKLLRNEHPDVICQRNTGLDMCGCLVAQAYGVPFVLEYNSSTFWHTRRGRRVKFSGLLRLVEAVNLRSADRIAVVSRVGKEYLMQRGIPASKIFINPNGADIRLFSPEVAPGAIRRERGFGNAVIAGFSGVYGPWHGIESLCAAIPLVARVNPEIIFLFIGDRELEKRVKDALNGATQLPRMEFIQDLPHQDVPRYLADCDILVSPHVNMPDGSPFFGSPVKLFEYMAMGKSIVASSVGQIGEILMPEVDALLVKPNHPEEIAAAILRLAADHGLREKLGRSARALCESAYAWEHNTERFVEQCHRIASRRSTRSSTG